MSVSILDLPSVVIRRIIYYLLEPENCNLEKCISESPIFSVNKIWREELLLNASDTVYIKGRHDIRNVPENLYESNKRFDWKYSNLENIAHIGCTEITKSFNIDIYNYSRNQNQLISLVIDQDIQMYLYNYDWSNVKSIVIKLGLDNIHNNFDNTELQNNEHVQVIVKFAKILHENLPNVTSLVISGCNSSVGCDLFGKELAQLFGPKLKAFEASYSDAACNLPVTDTLQLLNVKIKTGISQTIPMNSVDVSILSSLSLQIYEHFNWSCFTSKSDSKVLVFPRLKELTLEYMWEPLFEIESFHSRKVEFPILQKLTLNLDSVANLKSFFKSGTYSWPNVTCLCVRKIGNLKNMAQKIGNNTEEYIENIVGNIVKSMPLITDFIFKENGENRENEENKYFVGLMVASYHHQLLKLHSKTPIYARQPIYLLNVINLEININIPMAACLISKCAHFLQTIKLSSAPFGFSWDSIYDENISTGNVIHFSNLLKMHVQFSAFGIIRTLNVQSVSKDYNFTNKHVSLNCPNLTSITLNSVTIPTMKNVLRFGTTPWTRVYKLDISLANDLTMPRNGTGYFENKFVDADGDYRNILVKYLPNVKRLKIIGGKHMFPSKFREEFIECYSYQLIDIECDKPLLSNCLANSLCKTLNIRLDDNCNLAYNSIETTQLELLKMYVSSAYFSWKIFKGVEKINMHNIREFTIGSLGGFGNKNENHNLNEPTNKDIPGIDIYMHNIDDMRLYLPLKCMEQFNAKLHIKSAKNIELDGNVMSLPLLSSLEKTKIRYLILKPTLNLNKDIERFYEFTNSWLGNNCNVINASLTLDNIGTKFEIDADSIDWINLSELIIDKNMEAAWISEIVKKYPMLNIIRC